MEGSKPPWQDLKPSSLTPISIDGSHAAIPLGMSEEPLVRFFNSLYNQPSCGYKISEVNDITALKVKTGISVSVFKKPSERMSRNGTFVIVCFYRNSKILRKS
ncbi:uncharacterized protein H6S33_007722 [Morchella sextelata]|uniref:uncharacterized protein n=1 Tax=Morchella sextelata TaxID=1174677 RepID=UPI001D040DA4|nr:uncharacterized protein H6S33_007722 [Morchella sextelata]KAH0603400.1 hypothetical protein H6S33_007722 [Morchella sextelata]